MFQQLQLLGMWGLTSPTTDGDLGTALEGVKGQGPHHHLRKTEEQLGTWRVVTQSAWLPPPHAGRLNSKHPLSFSPPWMPEAQHQGAGGTAFSLWPHILPPVCAHPGSSWACLSPVLLHILRDTSRIRLALKAMASFYLQDLSKGLGPTLSPSLKGLGLQEGFAGNPVRPTVDSRARGRESRQHTC